MIIVNKGTATEILKEFQVESKLPLVYYLLACLSADFDVPVVGDYELRFHIMNPLTTIGVSPPKQFSPSRAGQLNLALEPNGTGTCSNHWKARIRIAVVSDDGRRSTTPWFTLQK